VTKRDLLRGASLVAGVVVAVVLMVLPHRFEAIEVGLINQAAAFVIVIAGLNLLTGFGGLISIGHGAFVGTGAYAAAWALNQGWSWPLSVFFAMAFSFALGFLVGIPALRIKGIYLALVTLAIAIVFPKLVVRLGAFTGGSGGKRVAAKFRAPSWTGIEQDYVWQYYVIVVIAVLALFFAHNMVHSRMGRAVQAMAENETAAAISGVNIWQTKTTLFGISAAYAGLGGSMLVIRLPFVSVESFDVFFSIQLYTAMVVGGLATILGAIPAGIIIVFLPEVLAHLDIPVGTGVVYGASLVLLTFLSPSGLVGGVAKLISRLVGPIEPPRPKLEPEDAPAAPS